MICLPSSLHRSDVFSHIAVLPKRTRKLALKHSDLANVTRLRDSVLATITPERGSYLLPRIIIHGDLSNSIFASFGYPSFAPTDASAAFTFPITKTAPTALCTSQFELHSDSEPETSGDLEPSTNTSATLPNIVISSEEDLQGGT